MLMIDLCTDMSKLIVYVLDWNDYMMMVAWTAFGVDCLRCLIEPRWGLTGK